jgi:lysozyme family protein
MADYKLLLEHIAKWEGTMGADPRDTCSKDPSDYLMPIGKFKGFKVHTVKGICFMTWKANAASLGLDPSTNGFIKMTTEHWAKIIKKTFWDKRNLDKVNSQKIAELIFEATWGSGFGGSTSLVKYMQTLIGVANDGNIGPLTIAALNKKTSTIKEENSLYQKLWDFRLLWLRNLASSNATNYGVYLNGWTNRMNALYERAKTMVATNAVTFSLIPLLVGAFFLYKYYKS